MAHEYDIIILGSGTTAFAGARIAAAAGKRVLLIEQSQPGGTCVNWGCTPSKTLIHKAEMYYAARKGMRWGLNLHAGIPDGAVARFLAYRCFVREPPTLFRKLLSQFASD